MLLYVMLSSFHISDKFHHLYSVVY